jgi:hypothetical protein
MVDDNQKISILLAEYNTLRSEVLAARSYIAQAAAITAGVLMGVLGLTFSANLPLARWAGLSMSVIAIVYLGSAFVWNELNTRKFTKRLRELEKDINKLAGEQLLVWETDYGWGSIVVRKHKPHLVNSTGSNLDSDERLATYVAQVSRQIENTKDLEIINERADELNKEALDVLDYQVTL